MINAEDLLKFPIVEIEKKLFEIGDYDFITVKDGKKHEKQEEALRILTDKETTEFGYGGAAGGAKSWTGCAWLAFMCELFPGTRWFIGREELKRLRESTYITWIKVCNAYGVEGWTYRSKDHYIDFHNGSRIDLLDLKYLPSDPLYERYGSLEFTGGWIEEGGEVHFDAYDTLKSRIGRHLNDYYGLIAKLFITFNPKKNWVDTHFYRLWKQNKLPPERKFLRALLYDNPHRESGYEEQLQSMSKAKQERLLHGNFDYDDDPTVLIDYDAMCDMFRGEHFNVHMNGIRMISADLAMQGRDSFVAGLWNGLFLDMAKSIVRPLATGKSIETDLVNLMRTNGVARSHVIVDSDGMGSYLESYLNGIKEFHAGARAINDKEFANLKTECAYMLAFLINQRRISIRCSPEQEEIIKQELGQLKADDIDNDTKKKKIISKEVMKSSIKRSPDYLDMLIMRMFFELKKPHDANKTKTWASSFR